MVHVAVPAVIGDQVKDIKARFGAKTALGKRRTEVGEPPSDVVIPLEAVVEREPVTVLCSAKGWVRTLKGHQEDVSDAKYKEGDRERFVVRAETTDKLLVFATNGRFYTIGCDKLPGGRGFGEPLRHRAERPYLASQANLTNRDQAGAQRQVGGRGRDRERQRTVEEIEEARRDRERMEVIREFISQKNPRRRHS